MYNEYREGRGALCKLRLMKMQKLDEIDHSLLISQLVIYAETVSLSCALDLLLKYGEIQLIWKRVARELGWGGGAKQRGN